MERRLDEKHHAVVVVAEGAGQDLMSESSGPKRDASGNVRLKNIGIFLKEQIGAYFAQRDKDVPIRYIDPSYTIRSLPANSFDAQLCLVLGQHAVHAGMTGRTNMAVGYWNQRFIHVPIKLMVRRAKQVDPNGHLWQRVKNFTVQPDSIFRT